MKDSKRSASRGRLSLAAKIIPTISLSWSGYVDIIKQSDVSKRRFNQHRCSASQFGTYNMTHFEPLVPANQHPLHRLARYRIPTPLRTSLDG